MYILNLIVPVILFCHAPAPYLLSIVTLSPDFGGGWRNPGLMCGGSRDSTDDGSASETPISIPQDCNLALGDSLLWFTEGYSYESVTGPVSSSVTNQNPRKPGDRYLVTVQRTGSIRCLNCTKQPKPSSESISGGGESPHIHFQPLHVNLCLYKDAWSLRQAAMGLGLYGFG